MSDIPQLISRSEQRWVLIISGLMSLVVLLVSQDLFFFWDTVQLGSKHAHWYYDTGFTHFYLPEDLDSGHPPLFGMYLALAWLVWGKSLFVSHLVMVPFVFGIFYFGISLYYFRSGEASSNIQITTGGSRLFIGLMSLVMCTPLMGHIILVSPDVILIFGFLATLYFIERRSSLGLVMSAIVLALISQRGLIVLGTVAIWILLFRKDDRDLFIYLIPGFVLFSAFFIGHYIHSGWNMFHDNSPWSPSFKMSNIYGVVRNVGIYIWRLIDFGMIFMWMLLGWMIYKHKYIRTDRYLMLMILLVCILGMITIPFAGLINHRYYLPVHVLLGMLTLFYVSRHMLVRNRFILVIICLGIFSGHRWIYPVPISQGWDTTLSHLPFYSLVADAYQFLESENIPLDRVGTGFPLRSSQRYINLKTGGQMKQYNLEKDTFILWSNVMNELNDDIFTLNKRFNTLYHESSCGIHIKIFTRR